MRRDASFPVRYVRQGVRHPVRHQPRAVVELCAMCGISAPARMGAIQCTSAARALPHVRETMPHMPHMPHIPASMRVYGRDHAARHSAHPAHTLVHPVSLKKKKEKQMEGKKVGGCIECTAENVAAFNARLRSELPEAYALARAFHSAGLMDGLRGARIGPAGSLGRGGVVPELSGVKKSRQDSGQKQPAVLW